MSDEIGRISDLEKSIANKTNISKFREYFDELFKLYEQVAKEKNVGDFPNPLRFPGVNKYSGELKLRNKMFWLRSIPLEDKKTFIIINVEAANTSEIEGDPPKRKKVSADLVGIIRLPKSTAFCLAELKYGRDSDHIIYAIMEGARNFLFHKANISRLQDGWSEFIIQQPSSENKDETTRSNLDFFKMTWEKDNPYGKLSSISTNDHLLIIGDEEWIEAQKDYKDSILDAIEYIQNRLQITVEVYSVSKDYKKESNPYMILPLTLEYRGT